VEATMTVFQNSHFYDYTLIVTTVCIAGVQTLVTLRPLQIQFRNFECVGCSGNMLARYFWIIADSEIWCKWMLISIGFNHTFVFSCI
jgi:hypothetical protein